MRPVDVALSALRDVKRALTVAGDIASDIGFQNDVNVLLANLSRLTLADVAPVPVAAASPSPSSAAAVVPKTRRSRAATRRTSSL